MVVSVSWTDQILELKAFRARVKRPNMGEKKGLWEPTGPGREKDEFSRLLWDRGKPDEGPVRGRFDWYLPQC
jgi:hypothetical protein